MIPIDPLQLGIAAILYAASIAFLACITGYWYGYQRGKGRQIHDWLHNLLMEARPADRIEALFKSAPESVPNPIFKRGFLTYGTPANEGDKLNRITPMQNGSFAESQAATEKDGKKPKNGGDT